MHIDELYVGEIHPKGGTQVRLLRDAILENRQDVEHGRPVLWVIVALSSSEDRAWTKVRALKEVSQGSKH